MRPRQPDFFVDSSVSHLYSRVAASGIAAVNPEAWFPSLPRNPVDMIYSDCDFFHRLEALPDRGGPSSWRAPAPPR